MSRPRTPAAGQAALLARRAKEVALCIDFDGTLSPIVTDPQAARPLPGIVELLGPLARQYAAVALISGRPAAYLAEHVAAAGIRYLGLYGLQEIHDGQIQVHPDLHAARPAVIAAREALREAPSVRTSGAWIEDKEYAVAVHTRRLAEPDQWAAALHQTARTIAEEHGLQVIPGKLVWELRPSVRGDKGDAVRRVTAESGAREIVFIGDDLGDLPAFAAVANLTLDGYRGLRIAVRSDEAPHPLLAQADLTVDGPAGVLNFLQMLAEPAPGADRRPSPAHP